MSVRAPLEGSNVRHSSPKNPPGPRGGFPAATLSAPGPSQTCFASFEAMLTCGLDAHLRRLGSAAADLEPREGQGTEPPPADGEGQGAPFGSS